MNISEEQAQGYKSFLEEVLSGLDDSAVVGIAKLAIDKGVNTLTPKQFNKLEIGVQDYKISNCPNCGEEIPYEDMPYVLENGMCASCQHDWDSNYED